MGIRGATHPHTRLFLVCRRQECWQGSARGVLQATRQLIAVCHLLSCGTTAPAHCLLQKQQMLVAAVGQLLAGDCERGATAQ
jgi:hypothetical protein